ncbi:hypothetical protein BST36_11495 [Mycolicibacterium moriokaense]|uniref:Anti-sigma-M factor RsmA n=1 Tax=Mycolicibacterium moriokaense TaxID=39691 RepID=A0AAD1M4P7_9MYCO|nr:hypothetical protein [Mycolicibacterium moriokaense]MCV7037558.1 hypothetical protein [Mycolicibacterium moriokaense]ORB23619.1 hypothetical protein BST36_11495 [Mycolicibacterium moriokaense]BBW99504.1 hypothetical protein MMOR_04410 [Mycolicibacterium moriokaense]
MENGTGDDLDPAVVERVRRDLAELASDRASAPAVPDVTARVVGALRAESDPAAHALRRPPLPRLHRLGLVVGVGAALAAVIVGTSMLTRDPAPRYPAGPTASQITVSRPATTIPLPDPEIVGLLAQPPDFGPLTDRARRESCLGGLGYAPGTQVLGARPLDMRGKSAVLMLLPPDGPETETVVAVVVEAECNGAHTGLLAEAVVTRT